MNGKASMYSWPLTSVEDTSVTQTMATTLRWTDQRVSSSSATRPKNQGVEGANRSIKEEEEINTLYHTKQKVCSEISVCTAYFIK